MKKILIILLLSSFFILSCKKIFFTENTDTRNIFLNNFHAVKVYGICNLVLIQDSANSLNITGNNDIFSIDAYIKDDTLVIDDNKKMSINPNKNKFELHFSNLKFLVTYDPVNVTCKDTLKSEQFVYHAIGEISEVRLTVDCSYFLIASSANTLGYFYLSGKADGCMLFNRYGCSMFADSLICRNAEIINESVGDVYVNASENIKAYIWGPGNIYYHGTPEINIVEKKGDGRLIRLE
jgi:hypothetical protein